MDKRKIQKLKQRLRTLKRKMAGLGPVMRGSVVELAGKCGNPKCRCARGGEKHARFYFSMSTKGKTRIIYLGKKREPFAREYSENYKALLEIVEEMTTINMELLRTGTMQKTR
jgi:hypothetical protein